MTVQTSDDSTDVRTAPVLQVDDLSVVFDTDAGPVAAVNGVSLTLERGEALGILGESGSGKSVTASAIMGILDSPPARVTGGSITLDGVDLLTLPAKRRRRLMGEKIAMVFQDALTALNPVHPVGRQIAELYRVHRGLRRREAMRAAVHMMQQVQIPDAAARVHDYPHQFSGGMRQRIMIAMALALDPEVLIADEPTTALDVTVQAQILDLLRQQQQERDMALILISHDLSVAAQVTDRLAVMYAGRFVETGSTGAVLQAPAHPYSLGLAGSVATRDLKGKRLPAIPGQPPDLLRLPPGCAFAPRCGFATDECRSGHPPLSEARPARRSACFHAEQVIAR
jgi:oligopeptide/dipeptide ABC transporter ATP-binding protein